MNYALDKLIIVERLPSSRGLGHIPFTDAAGVQIPLGVPFIKFEERASFLLPLSRSNVMKFCSNPF